MNFDSPVFALFLMTVLAVYYALRSRRAQIAWLLLASYCFYAGWDWRFCSLIAISTIVDFVAAQRIARTAATDRVRRAWLLLSVATNLGILGFFKYFGFFVESLRTLLSSAGIETGTTTLSILLPVGISFYTFQTMGYTIDVYRGRLRPVTRLDVFALYVSYFPQLVAGPIERGEKLLPQIAAPRRVSAEQFAGGAWLILLGLAKKVVLADNFGALADPVFADPAGATAGRLLTGLYLFTFQIYFDFSGYSDIARGVSRLLGIELCENFKQPYFARNVAEFWRRWHVSLSSWLRDYLYVALGGNRRGDLETFRNLMLVMLLGGLWHGASITFVVWGGLHGSYLVAHRLLARRRPARAFDGSPAAWLRDAMCIVCVFHLVALTWIFFRCPDLASAWSYAHGLLTLRGGLDGLSVRSFLPFAALLVTDVLPRWRGEEEYPLHWPWYGQTAIYSALLFALLLLGGPDAPFLYFQF